MSGGLILRLHETAGGSGCAQLDCSEAEEVEIIDFLERVIPLNFKRNSNGFIMIPFNPYQIISLRIRKSKT